jgi:hypothetical protein
MADGTMLVTAAYEDVSMAAADLRAFQQLQNGGAQTLSSGEAGPIAVGGPTLEKAFDKSVTASAKTVSRAIDAASDDLSDELTGAFTA